MYKNILILFKCHSGVSLIALVVTLVILVILSGVTITTIVGDNSLISKSQETVNTMDKEVESEQEEINTLIDELDDIVYENGSGGTDTGGNIDPETGWDLNKVTKVKSDDNVIVPVPIGFTKSTISDEGSVSTGFVIKQGNDGSLTSGINEFVWVPVDNPSEMFGIDEDGNSLGKLYDFGTSSSPKNPPTARNWTESSNGIMSWIETSGDSNFREPTIITDFDGNDATDDSSYFISEIGNINGTKFKESLQIEFEEMRESVETYGGFYIGRYETGNLSKTKAVVQKNNEDINYKNWYEMYNKCKRIADWTEGTSSMIWGCQWDATLKWFLDSDDPEVVKSVTDGTNKGNYYQTNGNVPIPTGSNENYCINQIYDMAGNLWEWTIEGFDKTYRVNRGGNYRTTGEERPTSNRYSNGPYNSLESFGCRATLYIK